MKDVLAGPLKFVEQSSALAHFVMFTDSPDDSLIKVLFYIKGEALTRL